MKLIEETEVIFRKYPKSEGGDVLALFPNDPGTNSPYTCSCYQHIGQHASADPRICIARTTIARSSEYADLKAELESYPYRYKLKVVKRHTARHLENRRKMLASMAGGK